MTSKGMGKMAWWGNGRQQKRVFEVSIWKFSLSLWREVKPPTPSTKVKGKDNWLTPDRVER